MNGFLNTLMLGVAGLILVDTVKAQTIEPVFPQPNQQIALLDLMQGGQGFQWNVSGELTNAVLEFRNPTNFTPQLQLIEFPVSQSPFFLDSTFRGRFLPGNYSWRLRSDTVTTDLIPFQIIGSNDLRPTPAPPIAPPSGDADGSSRIDKPDLYLLATHWKKNLFDENSADFNLDGIVDQRDILVMASRFGNPAVPPTPSPPVGKPGNIRFSPNDVIGFGELANFRILWEPPQFPQEPIFYELVVFSQFGQEIVSMRFLQRTEFQLSTLTQNGIFDVFLRAKTADGRTSSIAQAQFEIDPSRVVTPTPNFGNINLDFNDDGVIDENDSRLMINAFGTFEGDSPFISDADFNQDGTIDLNDVTVFQSNFPGAVEETDTPAWNSIVRPVMMLEGAGCVPTGSTLMTPLPPLDIVFANNTCIFAELFGTEFRFNQVDRAIDFFFTVRFEGSPDIVLQGFTGDQTFYSGFSILQRNTTFLFEVQSVNEGLQFSPPSETLRLTIPSSTGN